MKYLGKIEIKAKNDLVYSFLMKEIHKRKDKIKKEFPDVGVSEDYDPQDKGGNITLDVIGDDKKRLEKLVNMGFGQKAYLKTLKKWIEIKTKVSECKREK